ncbi:cytochrome c oxidase subunit II [Muricoccus aerilatus]|uniref:cytochrome c oxidase subunit II n=1 Tax=Muricoccus aerilatus TaxID=452982 RepID=UPI0005C24AE0|nr:cytochrome c oxidase subunit II [Roseomonas aerilata]
MDIQLWPVAASDVAARVDAIVLTLLLITGAIMALVLVLLLTFAIRYRRGSPARRGELPELVKKEVEIGWTAATLFLALFIFAWAAATTLGDARPVGDALEIHVAAKQWMWQTQHPNGAREIDALHLPRGTPARLLMTSQDVIHSFFVPAFRIKQDVLPGRLTELRFTPTQTGEFPLYCTEYCGTLHARMGGTVTVMEPEDYGRWLSAQPQGDDIGHEGAALFVSLGCSGCHAGRGPVRAPGLAGIWGRDVQLADGRVRHVDESYLRDSILQPRRDVVAGYEPQMPSFSGIVGEEELLRLVAYIRSLPGGQP